MFSLKRLQEKVEKEKKRKNLLNEEKVKKKNASKSFLTFKTSSKKKFNSPTIPEAEENAESEKEFDISYKESSSKPKEKDRKLSLSWRFFNNIEKEEVNKNKRRKSARIVGDLVAPKVRKSEEGSLILDSALKAGLKLNTKLRKLQSAQRKKKNPILALKEMGHQYKERKKAILEHDSEVKSNLAPMDDEKIVNKNFSSISDSEAKSNLAPRDDEKAVNKFFSSKSDLPCDNSSPPDETSMELVQPQVSIDSLKFVNLVSNEDDYGSLYTSKEDNLYLTANRHKEDSLLVAVFPQTRLFVSGNYYLKLVLGSITVLGYVFKEGEERVVFSPTIHSTLFIDVLSGVPIKSLEKSRLEECCIPLKWVHDLNVSKGQMIGVIEVRKYESNMCRILTEAKVFRTGKENSFELDLWWEVTGVRLNEESDPGLRSIVVPDNWIQFLDSLEPLNGKEDLSIVVTGGANLGKSTFTRFLINSFLSNSSIKKVACLDLDPGQSEFGLSSCLSLSIINSPVLGPSFTHWDEMNFVYQKRILLGDISVNHILREYLQIIISLMDEFRSIGSGIPLVVNTMGFTARTGFDIMVDILRIVNPTNVVTIESITNDANFQERIYSETICNTERGILDLFCPNLKYDLTILPSTAKLRGASEQGRRLRDINSTSYLSKLWHPTEKNLVGETCKTAIKIDWTSVAIHLQGSFVPPSHVLQAINASFVALCKVDSEYLEKVDSNFPLQIHDYRAWFSSNVCLGWGIVSGIDPLTSEIHILTPLDHDTVTLEVNVIALSKITLPSYIQKRFCTDNAPYCKQTVKR